MHVSLAGFDGVRPNTLGPDGWRALLSKCGCDLDAIEPGLFDTVSAAADAVVAAWPSDLPRSVIHADLFPDNVLMLGDRVTGLIDFYFACTDIRAYDLAILHSAWAFDAQGEGYDAGVGKALVAGYVDRHPLSSAERAALPVLAQGACLRFLATRAWDWLNTPADALVTRKDPLAYWRRFEAYRKDDLFA
jgi:homoserine kinase type II